MRYTKMDGGWDLPGTNLENDIITWKIFITY